MSIRAPLVLAQTLESHFFLFAFSSSGCCLPPSPHAHACDLPVPPLTFILCPSVDSQRQEPTKQHTNPIFKTICFSSFLLRPPPLCVQTSFLLVFLHFSLCSGFTPPWARRGLESSCDIMGLVRLHGLTDTTST